MDECEQQHPESVIERLSRELEGRHYKDWLDRDPRRRDTMAFKDAIIRAQDQMLAEQQQSQLERSRIKQAIARYEVEHKANRRITLKQICAEMNVNYQSTRTLKSRYAKQKRKRKKS